MLVASYHILYFSGQQGIEVHSLSLPASSALRTEAPQGEAPKR